MTNTAIASPAAGEKSLQKTALITGSIFLAKHHAICCVGVPLAANFIGGGAAAAMEAPGVDVALGIILSPAIAYGSMQWEKRKHSEDHDCVCNDLKQDKGFSWREFGKNTLLGYTIYGAMQLATPHVSPHIEAAAEKILPHDMFEMLYDHGHEHGHHHHEEHDHDLNHHNHDHSHDKKWFGRRFTKPGVETLSL